MLLFNKQKNTPGTRHVIQLSKNLLFKNNVLIKNLKQFKIRNVGRSATTGHITVRHKGSGCKRVFKKLKFDSTSHYSLIIGMCYDCNRNNIIALNFNLLTKQFFNSLAIQNTYAGSLITCQNKINELYLGYSTIIKNLPVGSLINSLVVNHTYAKYAKAAGTFVQLIQKQKQLCTIRLPSNKIITLPLSTYATLGINANKNINKTVIGKAGKNRLRGIRPTVRGIAMNPVDHPHGGRSNGGCHPKTPWGICTRGKKTRKK